MKVEPADKPLLTAKALEMVIVSVPVAEVEMLVVKVGDSLVRDTEVTESIMDAGDGAPSVELSHFGKERIILDVEVKAVPIYKLTVRAE